MNDDSQTLIMAMSGGVDSSVAAASLLTAGYDIIGVHLLMPQYGPQSDDDSSCCGQKKTEDARRVARKLDFPFYALNYRHKFEQTVLKDFQDEYGQGRTPNPCVRCNQWLKFGFLQEAMTAFEADGIATGHYARRVYNTHTDRWELWRGSPEEDQSYFLFSLSQQQLELAHFPLGPLNKQQVRRKAKNLGLEVHDSPKSTDLCFLPSGGYREVLRDMAPELFESGPIIHVSGKKLGEHDGVASYTIGQRRGLGISWSEPLYVIDLRPETNTVVVGEKEYVFRQEMEVGELNWIAVPELSSPMEVQVKIRFMHPGAQATIKPAGDDIVQVRFDVPQSAPTPGQAAVFYDGDRVIGGGFIE